MHLDMNETTHVPPISEDEIVRTIKQIIQGNVSSDQFYPVFQAQYSALDESLIGFEVLFRLKLPLYGFIAPNRFISVAEKHDLIVDLGLKIVEISLRAFKPIYNHSRNLKLSINASAKELTQKQYVERFLKLVIHHDIEPSNICIEITESAFAEHYELMIDNTRQLRELGFLIALDDFGKGFSSFRYLVDLDLDIVKIDRYFVDKPIEDSNYEIFISGLIFTLKSLGLTVYIEGIENETQCLFFKRLGVHVLQGFYLNRPSRSMSRVISEQN